jgi:hypothetical protein
MDHRAIAGPDLEGLYPPGLGEAERDDDELVLERPLGGDLEWLRHLEDQVGLADGPALLELPRRRRLGRIAFGGAGLHPGQSVPTSASLSRRSFENRFTSGSANHGGMVPESNASCIRLADSRASA